MDVYKLNMLLRRMSESCWVLCLFCLSACDDPVCLLGELKEAFKGKTNKR